MENVRCVTFDLDDTLWPMTETIINAEKALFSWLQEHCPRISENYSSQQMREHRTELVKVRPSLKHDVTKLREEGLLLLAKEYGYAQEKIHHAMQVFLEHRNRVNLFEGVYESLEQLSSKYTLGVITNGNADIDKIGLAHFFRFVVTAADVGAMKPDARLFSCAVEAAGVNRSEIVHVGDDPKTDVIGAMTAGLQSAWFNRDRLPWPGGQNPTYVVHSWRELATVL